MNITNHPSHPDELRRELAEKKQTAQVFNAHFVYETALPDIRASIDAGAQAAGLPVAVYAPLFARFMREISEARIAVLQERLARFR